MRGRDYVLAEDLQALAKDALRHRLVLTYQALAEEVTAGRDPRRGACRPCRCRRPTWPLRPAPHERNCSAPSRHPRGPGRARCPSALLRALDVSIGRRVEGLLAGDYRSTLLGDGTELAQVRPYVPGGDDVRRIDWNVTARTSVPHVRVHLAERVLVTWLVLDTSASMAFGTADRRKADVAEGVAIAVGHVATRRGNRLGLVTFGDDSPRTSCRRGRAGVGLLGLLSALQGRTGCRRTPARPRSAKRSAGPARSRSSARSVIVVSDFRGPQDWRRPLLELAGRHDVVAVEIRDPREQELPNAGVLWLVDPETGRQLRADTRSESCAARFAAAARGRARCAGPFARSCRSRGMSS